MKTSEVLAKAADLIDEHGWATQEYCDSRGQLCLVGAIGMALGVAPDSMRVTLDGSDLLPMAHDLATQALVLAGCHDTAAATWNDTPGRTSKDVTSVLRLAADKERRAEEGA